MTLILLNNGPKSSDTGSSVVPERSSEVLPSSGKVKFLDLKRYMIYWVQYFPQYRHWGF